MKKSPVWVLCTLFLFLGIIIGFMWAPVKNGIYCGNNNGNNNTETCCDKLKNECLERKEKRKNPC